MSIAVFLARWSYVALSIARKKLLHLKGRDVIRNIVRNCVMWRVAARPKPHLLGQLPAQRTNPGSIFDRVHPFSSPPFRRLPFRRADISSPAISSRGHFVAWHFVAGTLRHQTFCRGDTLSPAVSSQGHFVKGRRGWRTKTSIFKYLKVTIFSGYLI